MDLLSTFDVEDGPVVDSGQSRTAMADGGR
jgi:hypothetical protein